MVLSFHLCLNLSIWVITMIFLLNWHFLKFHGFIVHLCLNLSISVITMNFLLSWHFCKFHDAIVPFVLESFHFNNYNEFFIKLTFFQVSWCYRSNFAWISLKDSIALVALKNIQSMYEYLNYLDGFLLNRKFNTGAHTCKIQRNVLELE